MVGDPGGRSEERNLLDRETLEHNVARIKSQLERILDFSPGAYSATLVDNADWTEHLSVLDFLRDVGKHVTVNQMIAKDSVRSRIESEHGISYTEFSYMLLQANDFLYLNEHHGVELQLGGSDQWGNITGGIDLIRRRTGRTAHGLTWPLLLKSDGTKFGKTAGGAVWLDPERTSPYQFRQFWVNLEDAAVTTLFPRFSLRAIDEVRAVLAHHADRPEQRGAQRALADELTALVHGDDAARTAAAAADVLFGADPTSASPEVLAAVAREVPRSRHGRAALSDAVAVLVDTGLAESKGAARRLLEQRGVRANGVQLDAGADLTAVPLLHERWILLRRGRTSHHVVEISGE
jgi:tyrosyl-tRNA synthetase